MFVGFFFIFLKKTKENKRKQTDTQTNTTDTHAIQAEKERKKMKGGIFYDMVAEKIWGFQYLYVKIGKETKKIVLEKCRSILRFFSFFVKFFSIYFLWHCKKRKHTSKKKTRKKQK